MINLKGSMVTGDAIVAKKTSVNNLIIDKTHYILALKANHKVLYDEVKL